LSGCCLTPNDQFFSYIMARTSYIWQNDDDEYLLCTESTRF